MIISSIYHVSLSKKFISDRLWTAIFVSRFEQPCLSVALNSHVCQSLWTTMFVSRFEQPCLSVALNNHVCQSLWTAMFVSRFEQPCLSVVLNSHVCQSLWTTMFVSRSYLWLYTFWFLMGVVKGQWRFGVA